MEATMLAEIDPDEPQRGAADPRASVWVAASAGTGKTKVLSDRVLRLMLSGTDPRRILSLTYTRAAAAEMANRMTDRLGGWAVSDAAGLRRALRELLGRDPKTEELLRARALFARVLETPGGLGIQTIHAFCQSLLGRFPLEADVAPHARAMDERDAADLLQRALWRLLEDAERSGGPLADALAGVTRHLGQMRFGEIVHEISRQPGRFFEMIAAHGSVEATAGAVRTLLGLADGETPARIIAGACADDGFDAAGLRRAVAALQRGTKAENERGASMAAWLEVGPATRADSFDRWAGAFLTQKEEIRADRNLATQATEKAAPGTLAILRTEAERLLCVLPRRRAAVTAEATEALLTLAHALLQTYQRMKQSRALLDYEDLIEGALRLLRGAGAAWVLYKLDGGLDHLLIDEAQDTAPAQWRIIRELTAEFFAGEGARRLPRTVFAVGDVKQSIFSFQGAQPLAFLESRDLYAARVTAAGHDFRPIEMKTSFRSTRAVLTAVDATFAPPEMTHAIALEAHSIVHRAYRKLDGGSVEVWPPLTPRATPRPPAWDPPVARIETDDPQSRLAQLIALRIARMVNAPEPLPAKSRPIRAGDVMVLVRRRTAFVPALIRALKEHRVPVAGIDRMLLTEQLAVMDLLALARFALLPDDDLTLATVLKGPLAGLDDDALFTLAHGRPGTLWESLRAGATASASLGFAYGFLAEMLALADRVAPFEFFSRALGPMPHGPALDTGRRRLLSRLGRDADDPIAELLELALAYERTHPPSLQGFVFWLERADVEIKRDPETSGADAVRVMTVHGAKGLQAPIVFLPDSCQVPPPRSPLLWPKDPQGREVLLWPPRSSYREGVAEEELQRVRRAEQQEHMRLLYVAMTRAADRLIVCGWLTKKQKEPDEESWHRLIRDGLLRDGPRTGVVAEDDPFLAGQWALADGAEVLRVTCPQETAAAPGAAAPALPLPPLPDWARHPAPDEPPPARPLRPSLPEDAQAPPPVSPASAAHRFRRGRLIHRLLQELPELPEAARATAAVQWLARPTHGLSPDEQAEIAAEVAAVLRDPELAPLFGPDGRAEVPLAGSIDGRPVVGQVDRLLVSAETVTILDFKSDRPAPRSAAGVHPAYLRQMAAYRALLRRVYPGRRVLCVLLWTERPTAMALDDRDLDRWAP